MPTKHIDENLWKKVQDETVRAVILTKTSIKETEMLQMLIKKGLESMTEDDYIKHIQNKK
ncbi:hypothetical protein [Aggregatibacter actinomycetemcomitans]|uniref:hypothetical protein n=1 Tax=Aggregatibacter actinomycetemcomitans TaxID=714 RepID=UPI00197B4657|nr:hypothetical protein [Aggregatibacter actinomycetemcomitans]MBN6078795.1 hypothetical protein [Aggregatibacter actinomycetemcomitans]